MSDLAASEALGVVKSSINQFSGGYGYEIKQGDNAGWLQERVATFLWRYQADIKWVLGRFGDLNSGQLELVSTIVYVDQEAEENKQQVSLDDIVEIVREIKPHFSMERISGYAVWLHDLDLIRAAA